MTIAVVIVDDNALFREGVAQILESDGRFKVVGQASRGLDGIGLVVRLKPDLLLLDLRMPGLTGTETIRRVREQDSRVPIGLLTAFDDDASVQAAVAAGANGYLAKDATPSELCNGALALAGGQTVGIDGARHAGRDSPPSGLVAGLTPRELEVLRALTTRASNEAIAARLGVSPKTLRNHISNIYHKLGIYDRAQAVIVAVRAGLVHPRNA
jgi:DNA-binding NarL/FixJ family response regulator